MIHSELELASFPIHLAVNNQTVFAVAQRLNVFPLKLCQLDPFSGFSASLEQLQSLCMDSQPDVALRFLLAALVALNSVVHIIIHVVVVIIVIVVVDIVVAGLDSRLGSFLTGVDLVRYNALGKTRFGLVTTVRDLR